MLCPACAVILYGKVSLVLFCKWETLQPGKFLLAERGALICHKGEIGLGLISNSQMYARILDGEIFLKEIIPGGIIPSFVYACAISWAICILYCILSVSS